MTSKSPRKPAAAAAALPKRRQGMDNGPNAFTGETLSNAMIRRLVKRAGIQRVTNKAIPYVRQAIVDNYDRIALAMAASAKVSKHTTVRVQDVNDALGVIGHRIVYASAIGQQVTREAKNRRLRQEAKNNPEKYEYLAEARAKKAAAAASTSTAPPASVQKQAKKPVIA